MSKELEARLRQPPVFAEPAESQRCHLVMEEAADQLERYRVALESISVCNVSMNGAIARAALDPKP